MRTYSILNSTRKSFSIVLNLTADMISTGYFQWDDMYEAAFNRDIDLIDEWFEEIYEMNPYVEEITTIEKKPAFIDKLFFIHNHKNELFIDFLIYDGLMENLISNSYIHIKIDKNKILSDLLYSDTFIFSESKKSYDFLYGLKVLSSQSGIRIYQLISAISIGLLFAFIIERAAFSHTRFFYETRGLEKIIFLFEQNEKFSANHSKHVATIAHFLGSKIGIRRRALKNLRIAALLHDIGKISIPKSILNKNDKLTEEEFTIVKEHPVISDKIIENFEELVHLRKFIKHHHEKIDGSGYPSGLKGNEIPLESRIIAIADIFEALIGERPYRKPVPPEEAVTIMENMSLDREVLSLLKEHYLELYKKISKPI